MPELRATQPRRVPLLRILRLIDGTRLPVLRRESAPRFRFCGACGSALDVDAGPAAAPDLEERKVVTALFADLTASTEMASRLDPEDLRAVLRPFFDAMVQEIDRYGGTVEKFIGDAVVAAFGAPVAHEDELRAPERAVQPEAVDGVPEIRRRDVLGGLNHEYEALAA